jgi:hypothetical protein
MFVRFVVGTDSENPSSLTGVIITAGDLYNEGVLYAHESAWLAEAFAWFNANLPCPPFRKKLRSGEWSRNAVCWFRDDAKEPLSHLWDIVTILKEHGVPVRQVVRRRPGKIVYSDTYQVVAETPHWG